MKLLKLKRSNIVMTNSIDKQRVFELNIHIEAGKLSRQEWLEYQRDPSKSNLKLRLVRYKMKQRQLKYGKLWRVAFNINQARYKRIARLKKRVEPMVKTNKAKLLTATFNDKVLATTTEATRKTYVARYLKEHYPSYVANKDYGKTTNREHYHAIVISDKVDFKTWPYGRLNAKAIYNHKNDIVRTSKYVAKLSNHALKTSTKQARLIYSR
jgi:hypothetical protein